MRALLLASGSICAGVGLAGCSMTGTHPTPVAVDAAGFGNVTPGLTLRALEPSPALGGDEFWVSGELSFDPMPPPLSFLEPMPAFPRDDPLLEWMRWVAFGRRPLTLTRWPNPDPLFRWDPFPSECVPWPGLSNGWPLDPASIEHLLRPDESVDRWTDG